MYRCQHRIGIFLAVISLLFITACSDSSAPAPEDKVQSAEAIRSVGVFVDSPVEGLKFRYKAKGEVPAAEGVTNAEGEFEYIPGHPIIFSVGNVDLPETIGKSLITPLDLVQTEDIHDPVVVNILRLLQSLDADGDASTGISLSESLDTFEPQEPVSFESETFEEDVAPLLEANENDQISLIETEDAIAHFEETLNELKVVSLYKNDIRSLSSQTIPENGIVNVDIRVTDETEAADDITLTIEHDNLLLFPQANTLLSTTGAVRSLSLTPALNESGTATFTLTLSNQISRATKTFTITVANPDADFDGIDDFTDNCINTPNPDQLDSNENGIGDACETIDTQLISDPNFLACINELGPDTLIESITSLDCSNRNIVDTSGLEQFVALRHLELGQNDLTSVNVAPLTRLRSLSVFDNQLSSIDVTRNTLLEELSLDSNNLTVIDLSQNAQLAELWLSENQLSSLDLSQNAQLNEIFIFDNNITNIVLDNNFPLLNLNISNNPIDDDTRTYLIDNQDQIENLIVDDAQSDRDGDQFIDENDNCPDVYNREQTDSDNDGTGDACEQAVWSEFVWDGANWQ